MVPTVFNVGLPTAFPRTSNQDRIIPGIGVMPALALSVCIGDCSHCVMLPFEIGAVGAGLMVNVTAVLVNELQVPS